jgi:hypothetical protein
MTQRLFAAVVLASFAVAAPAFAFPSALLGETDVPSSVNHGVSQAQEFRNQQTRWLAGREQVQQTNPAGNPSSHNVRD